ncbi:MAG: hypothetical protein WC341_13835 [Bacteroidales bacterium]|jgi:hypothetical protein
MITHIELWISGTPVEKNQEARRIKDAMESAGMDTVSCTPKGNILVKHSKDLPLRHTIDQINSVMANYPVL